MEGTNQFVDLGRHDAEDFGALLTHGGEGVRRAGRNLAWPTVV